MRKVWSIADSIVSPLGFTSDANYKNLRKGISGVSETNQFGLTSIHAASIKSIEEKEGLTRFEQICMTAIDDALKNLSLSSERTLFILSTTKGNIDCLEKNQAHHPHISLHATAKFLAGHYGFANHLVVSNACISGVLALIVAKRFLESNRYDHAVVVGADVLSQFVVSGFQSLHALSTSRCRPFDKDRVGINLGEAASVLVLTTKPDEFAVKPSVQLVSGGLSNDANHISGPSRTGKELAHAIHQAMTSGDCDVNDIDFVSAHGTATLYNDEMEANAFSLSGLHETPIIGLKGYYGHTLGAAGVLETVMSIHGLLNNELIPTLGFNSLGVSQSVNICDRLQSKPLSTVLKTGSGFGGCNAALILKKENQA